MIRKSVIGTLTLLTSLWVVGFGKSTLTSSGHPDQLVAFEEGGLSLHRVGWSLVMVYYVAPQPNGNLRAQTNPDGRAFNAEIHHGTTTTDVALKKVQRHRRNHGFFYVATPGGVKMYGMPFWLPPIIFGFYPLISLFSYVTLRARHWRRRSRGLCVKCGYNLTGNVSGVCPECGKK